MSSRGLASIIVFILVLAIMPTSGKACSAFSFVDGAHQVFGKNYDWSVDEGLVFVNKRHVTKTVPGQEPALTWTSRYGSVTFNQGGREFPNGGMNEAGLVVELLWLEGTRYPVPDERLGIDCPQWVQFQLDNFDTVGEVIASGARIRINDSRAPLHYLVCDRSGDCAAIEFLNGKMVVHTAKDLPVAVLTNDTYPNSIAFLKQCRGFGGTQPIENSPRPLDRFARTAKLLRDDSGKDPITYAFDVLGNVAQGELTKWSIVYDMRAGRIFYRTIANTQIRSVDLAAFDFDCTSPVMMIDVNAKGNGNVSRQFQPYSRVANRTLIDTVFSKTVLVKGTPSSVLDDMAAYPDAMTHCRKQ